MSVLKVICPFILIFGMTGCLYDNIMYYDKMQIRSGRTFLFNSCRYNLLYSENSERLPVRETCPAFTLKADDKIVFENFRINREVLEEFDFRIEKPEFETGFFTEVGDGWPKNARKYYIFSKKNQVDKSGQMRLILVKDTLYFFHVSNSNDWIKIKTDRVNRFYPLPLTYNQVIELFGEPDDSASRVRIK